MIECNNFIFSNIKFKPFLYRILWLLSFIFIVLITEAVADQKVERSYVRPDQIFDFSYSRFPGSGWGLNKYHGAALNTFKFSNGVKLINRFSYIHYKTDSDFEFPENLHSIRDMITLECGKVEFFGGVDHSGDVYASSMTYYNFQAGFNYKFYVSGHHSLSAGFFYFSKNNLIERSKIRFLAFPMISYKYVNRSLFLALPIPIILNWRPVRKLSFNVTGIFINFWDIKLSYRVLPFLKVAGEYSYRNEFFYTENNISGYDKFFLRYMSAGARITVNTTRYSAFYFYTGYRFKTSYFYSDESFDLYPDNESEIKASYLIQAGMSVKFNVNGV